MPYPLLLHSKHRETSVTYEPFGEWLVPWRFDSSDAEYQALRTGVGLIDYSTQALIEVRGKDRASFLHNLLSNDITRLAPGRGCQAALLNASAKMISELLVLADADALWLLCDAGRAAVVMQTLEAPSGTPAIMRRARSTACRCGSSGTLSREKRARSVSAPPSTPRGYGHSWLGRRGPRSSGGTR